MDADPVLRCFLAVIAMPDPAVSKQERRLKNGFIV